MDKLLKKLDVIEAVNVNCEAARPAMDEIQLTLKVKPGVGRDISEAFYMGRLFLAIESYHNTGRGG